MTVSPVRAVERTSAVEAVRDQVAGDQVAGDQLARLTASRFADAG
ncbi:MAG: hypothetical protein OXG37_03350 [Actinomycetia bacterium]|nr:hypothetical protein [Actinomycetes bacterium]